MHFIHCCRACKSSICVRDDGTYGSSSVWANDGDGREECFEVTWRQEDSVETVFACSTECLIALASQAGDALARKELRKAKAAAAQVTVQG